MSRYFFFINGIRTDTGDMRAWNRSAERWVDRNCPADKADSYSYFVPAAFRWLKQTSLVIEAAVCLGEGKPQDTDLILVGHSNGADICTRMLREYPTLKAKALHLIAGATDSSYERNGLNTAVARGQVGHVYLWCSEHDEVLKKWAKLSQIAAPLGLGYGRLGFTGPKDMTPAAHQATTTIWHDGYGHSDYFEWPRFDNTMRTICGLAA